MVQFRKNLIIYTRLTPSNTLENLSERVLELLALPVDDVPWLLLDIGCGTRLSGETSSESGHQWIDVALEREVDGDLLLSDMGQDLGFIDGVINGDISISGVQVILFEHQVHSLYLLRC
ncbi:hypothetical protein C5167_050672 [Papaver somniferum]|uniref:Uncharacterized protein n=1 Tax=Papaver somniferum TaxID=3469 RepID=A0A4Y7KSQ9_PAPSO|nr:hypothetical protein C5167_050672 [Papaver somniferum]